MNVQFLSNEDGKRTAVVVPLQEWEDMQSELKRSRFLDSFTTAIKELKMIRDGSLPKPDINDLFND